MIITFWESVDGDWTDIYFNDSKVFGGHSLTPRMFAELFNEHIPKEGISYIHITTKYFKYNEATAECVSVDSTKAPADIGMST